MIAIYFCTFFCNHKSTYKYPNYFSSYARIFTNHAPERMEYPMGLIALACIVFALHDEWLILYRGMTL